MPGRDGPGIAAGSWPGRRRRRRRLARSLPDARRSGPGEPMRVDDLPVHGLAHTHVALQTAIRHAGCLDGEVPFPPRVAPGAEVRPLHGAEAKAMVVVVTRRAQTTADLARGGVTHEASPPRRGDSETFLAERHPSGPVVVQCAQLTRGEMRAGQGLLVLGLVAAAALAVLDGPGEVWMVAWRVALPTADALGRVETLGVVHAYRRRVAGLAPLDVRGGPGDRRRRIGARGRPRRQEAAGARERQRSHEQDPRQPPSRRTSIHESLEHQF